VQSYLTQIGIRDIKIVNTEKEFGQDWNAQYQNWSTPLEATNLLRSLMVEAYPSGNLSPKPGDVVTQLQTVVIPFMTNSVTGPNRLKGLLPKDTTVAHKTGTGGTRDGINAATNDIGIIYLSNGKHLAIAVFISDSLADDRTREAVIARIAKAAWDNWSK
jgi:beta-lactamase class A